MSKQKLKKIRKGTGNWVGSQRCSGCNSLSNKERIPDSGQILIEGKKQNCMYGCTKGWFHSSGTISS